MQPTITASLPYIAVNLLTGILFGGSIFFALSHTCNNSKLRRKRCRCQAASEHPPTTQMAESKLHDYIDLTLAKMKWAVCYALLGMLSGLAIMSILWIHPSPVSNKACIIPGLAAFFVEFLGATFVVMHKLAVLEARKSMLLLQQAMALTELKNEQPSKKELSRTVLRGICEEILEIYNRA
ncbi:MAG TPA: hypothetical protein VE035_14740 [Puia sp.]|nr:hypothetical protein [Puia sp.]